jgi:type I restriction enzyme S subunit
MLPKGWQEIRISNLSSSERNSFVIGPFGSDLVQSDYRKIGVPVVFVRDIKRSKFEWVSNVFVDPEKAEALKSHSVSSLDIVITKMGLPPGIAAVYPNSLSMGIITADIIRLRPNKEKIDSIFLCELLNSHPVRKQVYQRTAGQTRPKLTLADYRTIVVYLPPLPEQKKIAQILSTWDKAITTTEQLLANSQQQKKALMQQLLTGKKRLTGFEGKFKHSPLSDLVRIDAKSLGNKTPEDFEFQYISLSDVEAGQIRDNLECHKFHIAPSRARRIVSEGDILLATVRPNLQGFARISKKHSYCIASTGFSVISPKKSVCGDYLYHYLFGTHITGQINSLVVGTNYPAINSSDVAGLLIYCPEYEEQKKIADVLNNCDSTLSALRQKLDGLKQEKKALMQQLLTGKRRVKV